MFFLYLLIIITLVLLLYNYRTGIITCLLVITNCGEFVYLNPNLEIGDFGGLGTIFFMDLFWIAVVIVLLLKADKLYLVNYRLSFLILMFLCLVALIIPFLISSFAIKDTISVIRPLGNFLFLPYFVITITDIKSLNFFEKTIVIAASVFVCIQCYEYIFQKRIPLRVFEKNSVFFGEDPYSVEFGGIRTGYIWSRIGYLLPFNLFFGCYYYFSERRNYGLYLIAIYILAIMISLSRIWIIGFGFFLLVITLFLIFKRDKKDRILVKLFTLVGSFAVVGLILIYTSSTFSNILDIFLLRINTINNLADKTDASFLSREYILMQMVNVWMEYPVFGAGFSTVTRRLTTNDLGFPNLITIFGGAGIMMMMVFLKEFYNNIKPLIQNYYILFVSLSSVMLMITFMSIFSIDMFYFNATGAILFALGNIILNIGKQES
jgi:O-Antigen ligase